MKIRTRFALLTIGFVMCALMCATLAAQSNSTASEEKPQILPPGLDTRFIDPPPIHA